MKYLFGFLLFFFVLPHSISASDSAPKLWQVQSVDTMKYSRDLARQMLTKPEFDQIINQHISLIASTGATHVAIATPYDEEFIPILTRWVTSARNNGLHVWFRGNWSGWEGWFDYPAITRAEHLAKTALFIKNHPTLFKSGDIFSACPECENGGPGDPRNTGDVSGFRQFLIDLYAVTKTEFSNQKKAVASNYFSLNGDVARLVMDPPTTQALGGLLVVDHYVGTPEKLIADIHEFSKLSGGKIVLGEFGAPLPDLHPGMTAASQAIWLTQVMHLLADSPEVVGMNYWLSFGGSARLWEDNAIPRPAVASLTSIYSPTTKKVAVTNPLGEPLADATVEYLQRTYLTDRSGRLLLPFINSTQTATVSAKNYRSQEVSINSPKSDKIILEREHEDFIYQLKNWLYTLLLRFRAAS